MAPSKKTVTVISNTTSVQQVFGKVTRRFDSLFERRAFVQHYYTSRTEEMDLMLAREDLRTLDDLYNEVKLESSAQRKNNRISYVPPSASPVEKQ